MISALLTNRYLDRHESEQQQGPQHDGKPAVPFITNAVKLLGYQVVLDQVWQISASGDTVAPVC